MSDGAAPEAARIVQAPWTHEQVVRLNAWQRDGYFPPFTCGVNSNHRLLATTEGWICPEPECTYTQNWAHTMMASFDWASTTPISEDEKFWLDMALQLAQGLDQAQQVLGRVSEGISGLAASILESLSNG